MVLLVDWLVAKVKFMNPVACPSFSEAINRFRQFIEEQGLSSDLLWLFREDVVDRWPKTYLRIPTTDDGTLVEFLYDVGLKRGLGVHLNVFCLHEGRPCCYIWVPENEEDASYRMLSGLKLSVPEQPDRRIVLPVGSRLRWIWLRSWGALRRKRRWANDIPRRRTIRRLHGRSG